MSSSDILFSSSPTPAHQLHHPFHCLETTPSPHFRLGEYRRRRINYANQEDYAGDNLKSNLLRSERFLEAGDQEEPDEQTQEGYQCDAEHHSDLMDEQDLPAFGEEDVDSLDSLEEEPEDHQDEDKVAENVMIGPFSPTLDVSFESAVRSAGTAPPTPSPNPQGATSTDNVQLARVPTENSFLPAQLFAPNPKAMPPSSSPHRMDISPAPASTRCNIPSDLHQSNAFQSHSPDDPFGVASSCSQYQTLSQVSPTTSETRRTIGLRKAQLRPNLSFASLFLDPSTPIDEKSSPCYPVRASDCMDIDSPSYARPHGCNIRRSQTGPEDEPADTRCLCQNTSRSTSQSSAGKRNRPEEEEEHEQPFSPPSCGRRHYRGLSESCVASPLRFPLDGPSKTGRPFGATKRLCPAPSHSFSPFQMSSPSDVISPSVKAAAKMNAGHKTSDRSLSGFRFPASKSHVPSANVLPAPRPQPCRPPGGVAATSGNCAVSRRPTLGVVQSSATLFARHQSTSSTSTCMDRQRDVFGRPASKSRRAISFAATEGENLHNFMLQADDSMVADPDEDDEESELDDSLVLDCSPAARAFRSASHHPLVSSTWPKYTESPLRPNRNANHNNYKLSLPYKSSATSASSSLAPQSFNFAVAPHSPTRTFVASLGSTIESPVGMAFSEKERAGKILPCHKVSKDGLMRITPDTMDRLLEGLYDENISQKIVIDCRFGFEYEGGHIRTAINVQDKEIAHNILLQGEIFPNGKDDVPLPSESGKVDSSGQKKKVVVVFHCEYSAMRAPTVAKYLREQDRHMNMSIYPALHYPEVYILEGGYARYYAHSPQHCEGSYVAMDDPKHRSDRHADLNQFRTRENATSFRAKSFTYGDNKKSLKTTCHQKKPSFLLNQARGETEKPCVIFE